MPPTRIPPDSFTRLVAHTERAKKEFQIRYETDLAFRIATKDRAELLPSFMRTRLNGGSGFAVAAMLRHFLLEYADRLAKLGPPGLPLSFNVLRDFLQYSNRFGMFDLRPEREHLLRLDDYVDWYAAGSFPNHPQVLQEILPDGIVHAYNAVAPLSDSSLRTIDSEIRVVAIAMVRHGSRLSVALIAGENPPFPSDADAPTPAERQVTPGREQLSPDPGYDIKSRYLPELPRFSRVIVLSSFNLERARYDIRYVNLDVGTAYRVLTDDPTPFSEAESELSGSIKAQLARYDGLFSTLATMIYLPAFVLDRGNQLIETKFRTQLHIDGSTTAVRKAVKQLGATAVPFFRTVYCLTSYRGPRSSLDLTIVPPELEFEPSGHWKSLEAHEIGSDQDGNPIVGRTWVERTDSWQAQSLHAFVLSKAPRRFQGKDPGFIYLMRSDAHVSDLYKIGLSRRTSEERAHELSRATGVPTPLAAIADWEVGDCADVESRIHKRLAACRVNKRREFFRGNLQNLIATINEVVADCADEASKAAR